VETLPRVQSVNLVGVASGLAVATGWGILGGLKGVLTSFTPEIRDRRVQPFLRPPLDLTDLVEDYTGKMDHHHQ
jgi:hypothetical protein